MRLCEKCLSRPVYYQQVSTAVTTIFRVSYKYLLSPNSMSKCLSILVGVTDITFFVTPTGTLMHFDFVGLHNILVTLEMVEIETCR
jgi:hypothetical protein